MRIAVCLWGLCRSTQWTYPSFQKMILAPLKASGIQVDIYIHTYTKRTPYQNRWSGERSQRIDNEAWRTYHPGGWMVQDQDRVDPHLRLKEYRSQPLLWKHGGYDTLDNLVRSLYSLKQVARLWQASKREYDWIMYVRPDVRFLHPLDTSVFHPDKADGVQIPDFCNFPINDRFCIAKPGIARIYGERFDGLLAYSKQRSAHSETYLVDVLRENNIPIYKLPGFTFRRVRVNGREIDREVK